MRSKATLNAAAAAALGLALAGCGGGGGGDDQASTLKVSGTAATGAAIASATVDVKCKTGTGSASTSSAGAYTVSMEGGVLPCIVQVTGTSATGAAVSLHSVVETGADTNGDVAAVANVTPVTEMIVAQLLEKLPADAFSTFDATAITQTALTAATATIVDALKTAGFDLGSTDPLKDALVPAGGTTAQNEYDKLLDQLGEQVPAEALPLVVTQIATAAAADAPSGLTDAMASVSGGAPEGCPVAISGKYRSMDYIGSNTLWDIDFKNGKFTRGDGTADLAITTNPATPCVFVASGNTPDGRTVEWQVVQGKGGFGTYRARTTAPTPTNGVTGWIFPVQENQASALQGEWRFLQSGSHRASSSVPFTWEHILGKATVGTDLKVAVCDYDTNFNCVPDTAAKLSLAARSDGGFDLNDGGTTGTSAVLYAYQGPNGAVTVFGTTNPTGTSTTNRVSLVFTKPSPIPMPAVGFVSKYAESITTAFNGQYATGGLNVDSYKVTAVDATASTFSRVRTSDSREDVFANNKPLEGMRYRDQISGQTVPPTWQFIVSETAAVAINAPGNAGHFYSIAVNRP